MFANKLTISDYYSLCHKLQNAVVLKGKVAEGEAHWVPFPSTLDFMPSSAPVQSRLGLLESQRSLITSVGDSVQHECKTDIKDSARLTLRCPLHITGGMQLAG